MGLSMYEFAHCGINMILVPQSKIHKKIASNIKPFNLFEIVKKVGHLNSSRKILKVIQTDAKKIEERKSIYDGLGAKRLVQFFLKKYDNLNLVT